MSLWKTGQNATLKIEAVAGKANIVLEHGLGEAQPDEFLLPGKGIDVKLPAAVGLSRQQRRERRARRLLKKLLQLKLKKLKQV